MNKLDFEQQSAVCVLCKARRLNFKSFCITQSSMQKVSDRRDVVVFLFFPYEPESGRLSRRAKASAQRAVGRQRAERGAQSSEANNLCINRASGVTKITISIVITK